MAATDLNTVRSTIESRLATELASSPSIPVVFNNVSYSPTPDTSWVQCLLNFGANNYLTLGTTAGSDNRIVGVIVLNIFTPSGVGSGANFTIAKRIRDLYNRINVSGVYFDAPIGPEVVSASPEGYFQTQVRVTFEFIEEL
jgi:hypothetical protein